MLLRICLVSSNFSIKFYSSTGKSRPPGPNSSWFRLIFRRLEDYLQRNHPKAYKLQQTVAKGSKDCYYDFKTYFRMRREIMQGKQLSDYSIKQLHLYLLTPTDIEKLTMIIIIIILPLTVFILAFAVVYFPRLLLTRHFWTLEQTVKFNNQTLRSRRMQYYGKTIDLFVKALRSAKIDVSNLHKDLKKAGGLKLSEQLKYTQQFQHSSVQIENLTWFHKYLIGRCHGMFPIVDGEQRLRHRADVINVLDDKLRRSQANLHKTLDHHDLLDALFLRQLSVNPSDTDRINALRTWLDFTASKKPASWTLHAPVFSTDTKIF